MNYILLNFWTLLIAYMQLQFLSAHCCKWEVFHSQKLPSRHTLSFSPSISDHLSSFCATTNLDQRETVTQGTQAGGRQMKGLNQGLERLWLHGYELTYQSRSLDSKVLPGCSTFRFLLSWFFFKYVVFCKPCFPQVKGYFVTWDAVLLLVQPRTGWAFQ